MNTCNGCGAAHLARQDQHTCSVCNKVLCVSCAEMQEKLQFMSSDNELCRGNNCSLCDLLHSINSGEHTDSNVEEIQNCEEAKQSISETNSVSESGNNITTDACVSLEDNRQMDTPVTTLDESQLMKLEASADRCCSKTMTAGQGDKLSTKDQGDKLSTKGQGDKLSTKSQGDKLSTKGQGDKLSTKGQGDKLSTTHQGDGPETSIDRGERDVTTGTTVNQRKPPIENQPTCVNYGFMNQLFSQSEYNEYDRKIKSIKRKGRGHVIEGNGDVVMLCSEDDKTAAYRYCEYLKTQKMPGHPGVAVKASLLDNVVPFGEPIFAGAERAIAKFTFVFLYVSRLSSIDKIYSFFKEICLSETVEKFEKEGCLIIVYADDVRPCDIPPRFKLLNSVYATDQSKDTENALIKKLESKFYLRTAREKRFVDECFAD
ncbi:uncharacterized protein LOC132557097 [Ylistrum balloti]|uniref:uncharacterized protein LOC132557097 n=1 Tax=Ylistrum balloti TaxID=509963 RepID=UPI0029057E88|nr:uncharacterized protein LOC132557097 [Ylistrum balloti]